MLSSRSRTHRFLIAFLLFGSVSTLFHYLYGSVYHRKWTQTHYSQYQCPHLSGANDTLFILKTGGTESRALIPSHISTYIPCIPRHTIYSDIAEQIDGYQIHDTFDTLDEDIRLHEPDFSLYRQQQELQRNGTPLETLKDPPTMKKEDKQAWKLDKWKFLLLIDKAIETHPTASWYVFYEADTYINFSNLLEYLATLDSYETWYIGAQNNFGEREFAHGGAGYILSGNAARMVSKQVNSNKARYDKMVRDECCGDLILSLVFRDMGVPVTRAWPLLQGETPLSLDYQARNWCRPAISYHHMSPGDIVKYWSFEESWRQSSRSKEPIMHRDVFQHFVDSRLQQPLAFWDNRSGDRVLDAALSDPNVSDIDKAAHTSLEACEAACLSDFSCVQFAYETSECRLGYRPTLGGNTSQSLQSGWIRSRIDEFKAKQEPCSPQWTPS